MKFIIKSLGVILIPFWFSGCSENRENLNKLKDIPIFSNIEGHGLKFLDIQPHFFRKETTLIREVTSDVDHGLNGCRDSIDIYMGLSNLASDRQIAFLPKSPGTFKIVSVTASYHKLHLTLADQNDQNYLLNFSLSSDQGMSSVSCRDAIYQSDQVKIQRLLFSLEDAGILDYLPEQTLAIGSLEIADEKPLFESNDMSFIEKIKIPAGKRFVYLPNIFVILLPSVTTEDTYTDPSISYSITAELEISRYHPIYNSNPKLFVRNNSSNSPANFTVGTHATADFMREIIRRDLRSTSEVFDYLRKITEEQIKLVFKMN
jgi:hypothetical protein